MSPSLLGPIRQDAKRLFSRPVPLRYMLWFAAQLVPHTFVHACAWRSHYTLLLYMGGLCDRAPVLVHTTDSSAAACGSSGQGAG
jgi:hypothetical protein